ncbi:2-oxo-4-hydroxy-4-carboxy-5-ureidoimidazoline decarboxylase [Antribacter gilvus]|uniref:2-oxo-4-hydroxy-4-carboxy-5-ureidoimidazoline decarboxylase n=1 Tax=Antribacter gilvus TaxID=2304675 RepID=UPI000F7B2EB7|nr:2-oxo-4-hydroxy-4-carboxy-5-ureidoimidazoline decarboxylase [Antribacter gilvus]
MDIATFDALPASDAAAALRPCADVDRWVDALVAGRPYGSRDALLGAADAAARTWTADDVDAGLAHHPRIGEQATGDSTEARLSRGEQPPAAGDTAAAIARGNAEYERRFGRVFLVRAVGRTAEDILANLTERLGNDPAEEAAVAADQLRQIALLRLAGVVTDGRAA